MDGSRSPSLFQDPTTASMAGGSHRCGWCGLLPLPEERPIGNKALCETCSGFLKGVDWRALLGRAWQQDCVTPP
jgi:hypothetical protein